MLVFSSLFFGIAPDGGWFMYPPLTGPEYSPGVNTDVWILGLGFVEISAVAASVEFIVGMLKTRAPGMTLGRMPIFAWYMLVTAGMIMIGMPAVIAADILLELERAFGMPFYDATRGGDPLLWQHLFWLFGHPEVYIIFLPAAGMVSMMLPSFARTQLVGYTWLAMAAISVGFLSFGLWVHHMYTRAAADVAGLLLGGELAIAIPMGIQVFAWIATLWDGRPVLRVPHAVHPGLPVHLHGRRPDRRDGGGRAVRLAGARHLLRGRAFPLRAHRRHGLPGLRRPLLLDAVGHRADAVRAARAMGVLAHVRRLQRRVLADAHHRPARHAAAHLHLFRTTSAGTG